MLEPLDRAHSNIDKCGNSKKKKKRKNKFDFFLDAGSFVKVIGGQNGFSSSLTESLFSLTVLWSILVKC